MRQSPAARQRASQILTEEVDACVRKRLVRAGWSFRKSDFADFRLLGAFKRSWTMAANGIQMGTMNVWSHGDGAMLMVSVNSKTFSQNFLLTDTISPRRVSCLLVQWLKQAQVRQVMLG